MWCEVFWMAGEMPWYIACRRISTPGPMVSVRSGCGVDGLKGGALGAGDYTGEWTIDSERNATVHRGGLDQYFGWRGKCPGTSRAGGLVPRAYHRYPLLLPELGPCL